MDVGLIDFVLQMQYFDIEFVLYFEQWDFVLSSIDIVVVVRVEGNSLQAVFEEQLPDYFDQNYFGNMYFDQHYKAQDLLTLLTYKFVSLPAKKNKV